MMNDPCEIIRGLREDRDLRQIDIAKMLGTSQQAYSRYENGEYPLPSDALDTLADFYGVSIDYLMGKTDCKEGIAALNQKVASEYSVGKLVSDVLSLSPASRQAIIEYIDFQKAKEKGKK